MAEKFNAVVFVGIVGGAEDDAGVGAQGACEVGDAGCGQRAEEKNVHAQGHDAGCEGIFEHIAGKAGVFADDDDGAAVGAMSARLCEDMGGSATKFEGGLGGDWFEIGDAADAVGAEDFAVTFHVQKRRNPLRAWRV